MSSAPIPVPSLALYDQDAKIIEARFKVLEERIEVLEAALAVDAERQELSAMMARSRDKWNEERER